MNVLIILTSCLTIRGSDRFSEFSTVEEVTSSSMPWSTILDETDTWTSSSQSGLTTFQSASVPAEPRWISINRNSSLRWQKVNGRILSPPPSLPEETDECVLDDSNTYLIRSEGQCLSHVCEVKLKYNGSLVNENEACLSFILWIHGQPSE